MFNFFSKYTVKIINVLIVFLILIFISIMVAACRGNFKMIQSQLVTAKVDDISNQPLNSKGIINGYNKDGLAKAGCVDLKDIIKHENIPDDNSSEENTAGETEEITEEGEDAIEEQEQQEQMDEEEIKEESDNIIQNESNLQDIDFTSSDNFKIEVDLNKQKVFIYYKDNLLKEWMCSGGIEEKPTPRGEFETTQKGEYFWSDKYNMGAYYWIRFYNEYLFHSVPFDENNQIIKEEYEKLGSPASHGCIRLELENAKWLYEMLPLGAVSYTHLTLPTN